MAYCIYCGQEKRECLTKEHVVPRAVGGNLINNQLKIEVCGRCNSVLGMFVDAPFVKSWLTANNHALDALNYMDFCSGAVAPLAFMGLWSEYTYGAKQCELWLGPAGDPVLHFHEPYPSLDNVPPMVGVPSYCRGDRFAYDPGFVITHLRASNPVWMRAILLSVQDCFPGSSLHVGNAPTPTGGRFTDIPDDLRPLAESILGRLQEARELQITATANAKYADRFLAKLALGIGKLTLNDTFPASRSASLLRKFMWTADPHARGSLPVRGPATLPPESQTAAVLNWEGAHTVCLRPCGGVLALYTSFYGKQSLMIAVSDEQEHWQGKIPRDNGIVFVIAPGLRRYVGPKLLSAIIAHRLHLTTDDDLNHLENSISRHSQLPPFNATEA